MSLIIFVLTMNEDILKGLPAKWRPLLFSVNVYRFPGRTVGKYAASGHIRGLSKDPSPGFLDNPLILWKLSAYFPTLIFIY